MGKYNAQTALALRMVTQKGASVTFTRQGAVVDPVTQTGVDASTTYEAPMLGIALTAGKARHLFGEGADITKPRLSITIALSGLTVEPRNGDRFTWGGKTYALLSVEVLDPAGDGAILATGYAEAA